MMRCLAGLKIAVVCCCFLALAACSKKNTPDSRRHRPGQTRPGAGLLHQCRRPGVFLVDQSTLTPEGQETLRRQPQWRQQYAGVTIQVEGHADERGTREYNISLSARRATATRESDRQWRDPERISSIAYGKERPYAVRRGAVLVAKPPSVTVITGGTS